MKKIHIEETYRCTPETYWEKLWDASIFVVGGIIEGIIATALPKRQAKDVAYFNSKQAG